MATTLKVRVGLGIYEVLQLDAGEFAIETRRVGNSLEVSGTVEGLTDFAGALRAAQWIPVPAWYGRSAASALRKVSAVLAKNGTPLEPLRIPQGVR